MARILRGKQHILSIALSAALLCAAYFALSAYARYDAGQKTLETLTVRSGLLKQQQREMARKAPILRQVDGFLRMAHEQRLSEGDWATYEVKLQGAYSFPELREILSQCANGGDYYFKPHILQIKNLTYRGDSHTKAAFQPDEPEAAEDGNQAEGDVLLTLNGAFVARTDGK